MPNQTTKRKGKRPMQLSDKVVYRLTAFSMVKVGTLVERHGSGWMVRDVSDGRRYKLTEGVSKIRRPENAEDMDRYVRHVRTKREQGRVAVLPQQYALKDPGIIALDTEEADYAKYRKAVPRPEEETEVLIELDHSGAGIGEQAARTIEKKIAKAKKGRSQ